LIYAAANLKHFFNLFGLPMPAQAIQLDLDSQGAAVMPGGTAATNRKASHNLPRALTHFIGRQSAQADIRELLLRPEIRLVTLTGPGGTGKTRLGLETGWSVLDEFPQGVYFIDLAPISDPALLTSTTAQTVGVREGGGRPPLENLKDYLANKQMLLLFDNFEQITSAAPVIAEILTAAPKVKALVTSRIALHLRGEYEYPVLPLDLPPKQANQSLDETLYYEAVALFLQQAQAVQPGFKITSENQTAVVEICRRLDGLPLAIEIAAARIKMLSPQALLNRLDQSLKFLVGGAKDLPTRQQTLRQTIDWSYNLLQPEEKRLFVCLGVFVGGFTFEAVEAVCNPSDDIDTFTGIENLLNCSLLRQVRSVSEEPRFDMLQTLREYAQEKLTEAGTLTGLRQAHLNYFALLATGEMGQGIFGPKSVYYLRRFVEELDNLRSALAWCLKAENLVSLPAFVLPLSWFWFRYGHLKEGSDWSERMLTATAGLRDSLERAMAMASKGFMALWSADLNVAESMLSQSLQMSERLRSDMGIAMSKIGYGVTLINMGRDREAYPHLVDAVELFDQLHQPWNKGTSLVHLGNVSLGMGDSEQAIKWLDMAMPFMELSQDIWNIAFAYNNYGEVARALGDYEKTEFYYRKTEKLFEEADAQGDQARLIHTFGYLALHKGNLEEAKNLFFESLTKFRELGNHRGIAECLAGLASVDLAEGRLAWAATLLGAAERKLQAFGGEWWPADRVEVDRARERLQLALGDDFAAYWEQGQRMRADEAIAWAERSG
jgi:predicted ATPase